MLDNCFQNFSESVEKNFEFSEFHWKNSDCKLFDLAILIILKVKDYGYAPAILDNKTVTFSLKLNIHIQ